MAQHPLGAVHSALPIASLDQTASGHEGEKEPETPCACPADFVAARRCQGTGRGQVATQQEGLPRNSHLALWPRAPMFSGRTEVHPSHCDIAKGQGGAWREGLTEDPGVSGSRPIRANRVGTTSQGLQRHRESLTSERWFLNLEGS